MLSDDKADELVRFVYGHTLGQNIIDADATLDAARRTLWAMAFTKKPIPAQMQGPAFAIARGLAHLPLDQAHQVVEGTRLQVWQSAFPDAAPNLFGGFLDTPEGNA